jgi:dCTP deaminase
MVLCDSEIRERAERDRMIEPFEPHQVKTRNGVGVISYGVSSYGYDMRVGNDFKVFKTTYMPMVDPKKFDARAFDEVYAADGETVIIPPNSFALAQSVEYFRVPRDVVGIVLGKSTYARCGIHVNCTPMEPEWEGILTIEISNNTPLPALIYAGEGIAQVLFMRGSRGCDESYKDKAGKYQNQTGITLPRL